MGDRNEILKSFVSSHPGLQPAATSLRKATPMSSITCNLYESARLTSDACREPLRFRDETAFSDLAGSGDFLEELKSVAFPDKAINSFNHLPWNDMT
jgi:hypothetical protein